MLREGETVVVRGGASAVGTAAIQLAVAAGARVIAVAGGPEKAALCTELGAARAVDHTAEDVFDVVMDETGDRGADVIFDPIGGDQTEMLWTCGALGGRYLAVGFNDDPESGLTGRALRKLSMANMTVMGVLLAYLDTPRDFRRFGINGFPPEVGQRVHEHLLELVAAGRIRPVVGRTISLDEVGDGPRGPRRPAYLGPHRRGAGPVNVDEIVAAAVEQTGLDDFGEDLIPSSVVSFREGLELYVDSLDREAQLNELGDHRAAPCRDRRAGEPAQGHRLGEAAPRGPRPSGSRRRSW